MRCGNFHPMLETATLRMKGSSNFTSSTRNFTAIWSVWQMHRLATVDVFDFGIQGTGQLEFASFQKSTASTNFAMLLSQEIWILNVNVIQHAMTSNMRFNTIHRVTEG